MNVDNWSEKSLLPQSYGTLSLPTICVLVYHLHVYSVQNAISLFQNKQFNARHFQKMQKSQDANRDA